MKDSKYLDLHGNPIPKRCPICNELLADPYGSQKYCSEECRDKAQKERSTAKKYPGAKHKYPSPSEREIEEDNAEVMKPGSKYASYGKRKAAKMAKAMGEIHAPAGFTSYEERKAARLCD